MYFCSEKKAASFLLEAKSRPSERPMLDLASIFSEAFKDVIPNISVLWAFLSDIYSRQLFLQSHTALA